MSQQINLFNPALVRQKDHYNALTMARLVLILLAMLTAVYIYARHQSYVLGQQREQVAQQLRDSQAQLVEATRQFAPRQPSKALQDELAATEARLRASERVLAYLRDGGPVSQGFSGTMRAFARQRLDGLWLTGFAVDGMADDMTITGRALRPELVPQYIGKLGADPALQGRTFAELNIARPKAEPAAKGTETGAPAALPPPYIEFGLQSRHGPDEAKPAAPEKKS